MFTIPAEARWQRLSLTLWRKTKESLILPGPNPLHMSILLLYKVMQEVGIDISREKPKLLTSGINGEI